ncbi:hypothetical protein Sango_2997800 [Sesamum angolense]|uniref:Retrotransposon Copia-like N-terminal domain-containing protein n=1 Tax=Sesamum angolense TaxID=2727404 RepID=A0AAE1VU11_9LAMI|nr:hypothetical protein Sango_2997800 [Sesamum angolense]
MKLQSADHPGMGLVSISLDGTNYLSWSRAVRLALGAKQNLGFIDGKCIKPVANTEDLEQWQHADYMSRGKKIIQEQAESVDVNMVEYGDYEDFAGPGTKAIVGIGRRIGRLYILDKCSFDTDTIMKFHVSQSEFFYASLDQQPVNAAEAIVVVELKLADDPPNAG